MMNIRVISAAIAIPILLFFVLMGGDIFNAGVLFITAIGLYEYVNVYKNTNHKVIVWPLVIGYVLNSVAIIVGRGDYVPAIIYLVLLISMAFPIFTRKYNVLSSAISVTGFVYVVIFFSMLINIMEQPQGKNLIWLVFIIAFFSDTFAYYAGRTFGKRKLCPEVSPKKTIEGSIGGIFGSIIGVVMWGYFNRTIGFQWYQLVILGGFGSVISQTGDLSASLIKRFVGVKDYGNIMPGHGGVLDRFDSILFTAPVVYYYIVLILG